MTRLIVILLAAMAAGCQEPDFRDAQGRGHNLEEFQGKWLFVNYWATWCAPCIKEIPELNKISKEYSGELLVYGVNYDGPAGDELDRQIDRMKIDFPVFDQDPHEWLGVERPQVLPTTFVFSPEGEHVETLVGAQTEEALLAVMEQ